MGIIVRFCHIVQLNINYPYSTAVTCVSARVRALIDGFLCRSLKLLLLMSTAAENVLQHCDNLLQDIISFKGTYRRGYTTDVPGTDYPKVQEHTKGDDIWTFYRSVQTERTSIEKVISNRLHADNRQ